MRIRKGFTLVELVVVIMILGILATVAVPKLLGTAKRATDNGLKQTLASLRDAIELYTADNEGVLPGQSSDLPGDLAPYLRGTFPVSPVGAKVATITYTTGTLAADASPTTGWKFATDTGEIILNCDDNLASDSSLKYEDL